MFKLIKSKNITLILLNARITKKTFNRWLNIKNFSNSIFGLIDRAYSQNVETSFFLKKLNVKKIKSIGNLKFIEDNSLKSNKADEKLFLQLNKYKTFVAASTHDTEELFAARTHILLKKKVKNLITIIIPRHIERKKEIADDLLKTGLNVEFHTLSKGLKKDTDIYIVDTYGETSKFYSLTKLTFVGGSLILHGGQNPLEPAREGNYILSGPNIGNFKEVYEILGKLKIYKKINSVKDIKSHVLKKINYSQSFKVEYKLDDLGDKIINKNILEIKKFI